ncbi:MAG: HAD-IA family hydrolase [Bacteroidales bacterium]|nr:HAD-IA family hydrolase [Bacteroidales bacterium]
MQKRLVIFDLDGTLLDTIDDLSAAVNHSLSLRGLPLHTREEYVKMVGHGVRNLVFQALPQEHRDDAYVDAALADFVAYYTEHIDHLTQPYPGMQALVEALDTKGYGVAVASNKFQAGVERLIAKFFPGVPFVQVLGNAPGAPLKPSPEIVFSAMDKAGISREESDPKVVMVGDSRTDMKTAVNAGVKGIAVTWGFRPVSDFDEAQYVANTAEELSAMIDSALE